MVESDSGSSPDQVAQRAKAVAVKRRGEDALPRITATGRGKLAERILDIAFEHQVKVRQDKELVDILDTYALDSPVPVEALGAVSEILRYVYAANRKLAPADMAEGDPDRADDGPDRADEPGDTIDGED